MNIRFESLSSALAKNLEPLYLLAGSEPLLVQESRDLIIKAAQEQGFLERQIYQADAKFDWHGLGMAGMEQSLFASRKIIDLRIPSGKPGTEGSKYFVDYCQQPDRDVLLIISCGAWDGAARKSKWATELANAGGLVEIWPVKPNELPGWIARRMKAAGLKAGDEAVRLLAEFVEGNLLAAQQEIDKICLLNTGDPVTVETIREAVSSSARFDAFRLGECLLQGKTAECLRVAAGLQRTGVAIQAVMGALIYQLNQLEGVRAALASGASESSAFARHRVFGPNQALFRQAVRRIPVKTLSTSFNLLKLVDQQSKGQAGGEPWLTLDQMLAGLAMAGTPARNQAHGKGRDQAHDQAGE